MKFSVCIPNFNYGGYIGETIDSVLQQDYTNFEVLISDNKSTDNSWEVIQQYVKKDSRVKARQNATNLGFAGNLDPASEGATGDYMILLSSDDIMNPGALSAYKKLIELEGNSLGIVSSACNKIDSDGKLLSYLPPTRKIWGKDDVDVQLSEKLGYTVYKVKAGQVLKKCLKSYYAPFYFAATCYSKEIYEQVGKYGGSRLYNPDKWFHWRALAETEYAYIIDAPLFGYRWHQNNQVAVQKKQGALKYLTDEYRSSFEVNDKMLAKAGLTLDDVQRSYVFNVIQKQAFRKIKENNKREALRILRFGLAGYPNLMRSSQKTFALFVLAHLGKVGYWVVKGIKKNFND